MPLRFRCKFSLVKAGFTLLELMMACAVVALLIAIAIPATSRIGEYTSRTKSISNLRQIGVAARLYANDHNQELPGQPSPAGTLAAGAPADQWPALFCAYLTPSDPTVFLDAGDPVTSKLPLAGIVSNATNNTAFIYNGFDDLAANNRPPEVVSLSTLPTPAEIVLLAQKSRGATAFHVSPLFEPVANLLGLLNPAAYDGGSHYLFADGSVRFILQTEYSNNFWLVDKNSSLPFPPWLPLPAARGSVSGLATITF